MSDSKFLDPRFFWTQNVYGIKTFLDPTLFGSKIHLRMEFDSGVGPTCYTMFSQICSLRYCLKYIELLIFFRLKCVLVFPENRFNLMKKFQQISVFNKISTIRNTNCSNPSLWLQIMEFVLCHKWQDFAEAFLKRRV